MNDFVLARYLKTCCRRLHQQQTALVKDFSLCSAIEMRQASGMMQVDVPERGQAIATITPIARYSPNRQTWRWAWAEHQPYPNHQAISLQSLAQKTGLELFTTAQFQLSLEQVSLLLAMACSRLKASGYYRWLDGEEFVFFAVQSMALAQAPLASSSNGDRLQIATLERSFAQGQTQVSSLLCPAANFQKADSMTVTTWPHRRSVEGLFVHTLCRSHLLDVHTTIEGLKNLHRHRPG